MSRMAWWRWSGERLRECGWSQGVPDDPPCRCGSCGRGISGVRIWWRAVVRLALCRRCAVERTFAPRVIGLPQHLRMLRAMVLQLLEDGWSQRQAIREEAERRLRLRPGRISRREWRAAWSDAWGEYSRRKARRTTRPYDGSSRFGWRPGR